MKLLWIDRTARQVGVLDKAGWRRLIQTLKADKARDSKQNDERASAGCCGAEEYAGPHS